MLENYPSNCWYVAANSEEVGRGLLGRELLGEPVLLYRRRSGDVVALEDFCPHRSMPLSQGWLADDQVVCRYHGFTFAPSGECVRVPSQEHPPLGAHLRVFPVREEPPYVWIWPGDPRRAGEHSPPALPWLAGPGWTTFGGRLHAKANYLTLHDNSLDLTHFPYLHRELALEGYRHSPPQLDVAVDELSVSYRRQLPPDPLPDWLVAATGLKAGESYAQRESGVFASPALHINHIDIVDHPADGGERLYEKVYVRGFTPQDSLSTHVFWWVARNYAVGDEAVTKGLRAVHERLLSEDIEAVETVQAHALHYGRSMTSTLVTADAAAVKAHEIVSEMIRREGGQVAPGPRRGFGMITKGMAR